MKGQECSGTKLQTWFLRVRSSFIKRGGKRNCSGIWCCVCFSWPHSEAPHNSFLVFSLTPNSCQTEHAPQFLFFLGRYPWHLRHRLSTTNKWYVLCK